MIFRQNISSYDTFLLFLKNLKTYSYNVMVIMQEISSDYTKFENKEEIKRFFFQNQS